MYCIIGANGYLGTYLLKNVIEYTNDDVIATARNIENVYENSRIEWVELDVTDKYLVEKLLSRIKNREEAKIVYLAAYHNPDLVEKNPELAWDINVTALSYFINRLGAVKSFFYPSTDSVYGNSIDRYHFKENDKLSPVNTYGKQKAAAEAVVMWHGGHVARFPFLIAPSLSPIKKHFYDKLVDDLSNGKAIEMFTDSLRSSLNFDTAAELLIRIMEMDIKKVPFIINICGDADVSKYEIGVLLAKKLGVNSDLVVPVSVLNNNDIFEAKRAHSSLMDNTLLKNLLGISEVKLFL